MNEKIAKNGLGKTHTKINSVIGCTSNGHMVFIHFSKSIMDHGAKVDPIAICSPLKKTNGLDLENEAQSIIVNQVI